MKPIKTGDKVQLKNPIMEVKANNGDTVDCILEGRIITFPTFLLDRLETQDEIDCHDSMSEDIDRHLGQD